MDGLKQLRKMKGLTLEQLAKLSGVSSKSISLYEHTPPGRPSGKVVQGLSRALEISPEELLMVIGIPGKDQGAPGRGMVEAPEDVIELEEAHVSRLTALVEKEIVELQHLLMECASFAEDHPALLKSLEYISADIDFLAEIKKKLQ